MPLRLPPALTALLRPLSWLPTARWPAVPLLAVPLLAVPLLAVLALRSLLAARPERLPQQIPVALLQSRILLLENLHLPLQLPDASPSAPAAVPRTSQPVPAPACACSASTARSPPPRSDVAVKPAPARASSRTPRSPCPHPPPRALPAPTTVSRPTALPASLPDCHKPIPSVQRFRQLFFIALPTTRSSSPPPDPTARSNGYFQPPRKPPQVILHQRLRDLPENYGPASPKLGPLGGSEGAAGRGWCARIAIQRAHRARFAPVTTCRPRERWTMFARAMPGPSNRSILFMPTEHESTLATRAGASRNWTRFASTVSALPRLCIDRSAEDPRAAATHAARASPPAAGGIARPPPPPENSHKTGPTG